MKKILYSDYLFHHGIRNLNSYFAKVLSKDFEVYYCANEDYINSDNVKIIYDSTFCQTKGKIKIAYRIIQNAFKLKIISDKLKPDYIIIGAYETRTLSLILKFFRPKAPLILMENNNIDQLIKPSYLRMYKKTMNEVYHIALEDYIADFMVSEIGVIKDNVFIVKHPYYNSKKTNNVFGGLSKEKFNIIALSDSNDERFVKEFIDNYDSKTYNNIRIYIKSKKYKYESKGLIVSSEYLSDERYKQMFADADVVLLPFSQNYKYRISGNLIDAISNGKLVIATPFEFAKNISSKFPNIVRIITAPKDVYKAYSLGIANKMGFYDDIVSFKDERSELSIFNSFKEMFASIDLRRK